MRTGERKAFFLFEEQENLVQASERTLGKKCIKDQTAGSNKEMGGVIGHR